MMRSRWGRGLLVLAGGMLLAICALAAVFEVREMASSSMEPVILGQGRPPSRQGDRLIIMKRFYNSSLKRGSYVLVESERLSTVRRIAFISGERVRLEDGSERELGSDEVFLEAEQANGIDSFDLGPFKRSEMKGKVVWGIRGYGEPIAIDS